MSGLYLHIPFCRQACTYCDFHFSTRRQQQPAMVAAILQELEQRAGTGPYGQMKSIYLGGGTPSLLSLSQLESLLQAAQAHFSVDPAAEITLEANPDDLSLPYLKQLRQLGINRLSIGLQSFDDAHLQLMNRAHSARQSRQCLEWIRAAGFDNFTVDLIYGVPRQSQAHWEGQLAALAQFQPPHFSAYALTVEPRTVLAHQVARGTLPAPEDEVVAAHFAYLQQWAAAQGYEHYELSNLALPGRQARHNSSYWQGLPYLGLGPGAHSFDGKQRYANVANNPRYLKAIKEGKPTGTSEWLRPEDHLNEYLMTRLRLAGGFSWADLTDRFGPRWASFVRREAKPFLEEGRFQEATGRLFIPTAWRFHSDGLAAELFALQAPA
ncbi:MAG: radical SAM family heme chaperone HemW [Schleiferiaceae bacterium]|nr:radical SAM family heme chaperone HemW [Schleiferiaceae bacterium]